MKGINRLTHNDATAAQLMKIVKERVGELQKLAQNKGGDIASKAAQQIPGADKVTSPVPADLHSCQANGRPL